MFERRLRLGAASFPPTARTDTRHFAPLGGTDSRHGLVAEIARASRRLGLEGALGVAVARVESGLDPRARSPDGRSTGLFQLLAGTRSEMRRRLAAGRIRRASHVEDVALGVGYLRYLYDLFGRRAELGRGLHTHPVRSAAQRTLFAVAAFNAGEGRVAEAQERALRAGRDPTSFATVAAYLPPLTRSYVRKVLATAARLRAARRLGAA